jgi:hypothetical protein
MTRKWFSIVVLIGVAIALLAVSNCGDPQELTSITIEPGTETFGESNIPVALDAGLTVQLRALGNYVHPPVQKDITSEVTWVSNDTQMIVANYQGTPGLIEATGNVCGGALVSATVNTNADGSGVSSSGAIVTGYMNANVTCFTGTESGNPALSITFQGGTGNVTSSPTGLGTCDSPGPCITQAFTSGTIVTLTANPTSPSTTGTWPVCPSASGNTCTVDVSGNTTVTVAFN